MPETKVTVPPCPFRRGGHRPGAVDDVLSGGRVRGVRYAAVDVVPDRLAELRAGGRGELGRWFGLLSQRAIKRGSFHSVTDLVHKIQAFIDAYNTSATPFVWVASAQSIIDKVARIAMRISGTAH